MSFIICPNCQYDRNPKNTEFCEVCGHSLAGLETASPPVTAPSIAQPAAPSEPAPAPPITPPEPAPAPLITPPEPLTTPPESSSDAQTCTVCGYQNNPIDIEFCESCGSSLSKTARPVAQSKPASPTPEIAPPTTAAPISAKLISKQVNAPTSEFILSSQGNLIGRFDTETGPVDVDLDEFPTSDTVSRQHGYLFYEGGQWKIKDLGSVNGIFIRRTGTGRFSSRIVNPEALNSEDEIAIGKVILRFQHDPA